MTITIVPVTTPAELDEFIRLPVALYGGMPGYAPSMTIEREAVLHPRKGSFFAHGKVQYWLAQRDGRTAGRISAQLDEAQPEATFDGAGLFGCLDSVDDPAVVRALLTTAEEWLRQQGRTHAVGPFALNMNSEPGVLVEGQDEPPLSMVSWHPRYLERLVYEAGYAACKDLHYWRLSNLEAKVAELGKFKRPLTRVPDLKARPLNMKRLEADIEIIRQLYNDGWKDNWGFVPLQRSDVAAISKDMRPFVKPEFGVIVEKAGKPLGAALIFPNLYEVSEGLGTDPSLVGWAKLGYRTLFHRFRTGFVILLGVLTEIRHSVGGALVAMALINEMVDRFAGYEDKSGWLEAGWVLDNNVALQKILLQYGFEKKRTLRLFEKTLPAQEWGR
jgi:hypothetical protein